MKRKIIIGLSLLLLSSAIYAKGGHSGGSFGQVKSYNKYGKKEIITNSRRKTTSFNNHDICQKYIYIETKNNYRYKGYIWYVSGDFRGGYATTNVTIGNDSKNCQRKKYNVPYLSINQIDNKDRVWISIIKDGKIINQLSPAKIVKHIDGRNKSSLRLNINKQSKNGYNEAGTKLTTEHKIKFLDKSTIDVFIQQ
jgi:hypothetical protein